MSVVALVSLGDALRPLRVVPHEAGREAVRQRGIAVSWDGAGSGCALGSFPQEGGAARDRSPKRGGISTLKAFKTWLDKAGAHLSECWWESCCEWEVGLETSRNPLCQPAVIR